MALSTRDGLASRVAAIGTSAAKALADFVTKPGTDGAVPCWGAIVDKVSQDLNDDSSLEAMWKSMVGAGDPRPLILLLNMFKGRSNLLELAMRDEARVPPVVRQALAALRDPKDIDANRGFATRVNELLAFRYFMPDSVDPKNESHRRSK